MAKTKKTGKFFEFFLKGKKGTGENHISFIRFTKIHRQPLPPAAKTLFIKRVLDSQKFFIKVGPGVF